MSKPKVIYTNEHNIPLPLQLWLINDDYDHDPDENVISVTTLLKSVKRIVLGRKYKDVQKTGDFNDLVAMKLGTSVHNEIEDAMDNSVNLLMELGYEPDKAIELAKKIKSENRTKRAVGKYIISGKYDVIFNSHVGDYKTTSVWKYILDKGDEYIKQMSIYKWLNPKDITANVGYIFYIFTDWSKVQSVQDIRYPQSRIATKEFPLMSNDDTEEFVTNKLAMVEKYTSVDDDKLPDCTTEELWQDPEKYAYYKNPAGKRATKVFEDYSEANDRLSADGNVGKIETRPSKAKACGYCNVREFCSQYIKLKAFGQVD